MTAERIQAETPHVRAEVASTLASLVDSLARARTMAAEGSSRQDLADVLGDARRKLDLADEKLLALDRHRQRSFFRRAGRIRLRIDDLHRSISRDSHGI